MKAKNGTVAPVNRIKDALETKPAPARIVIPKPDMQLIRLNIIGLSPLMVHRWGAKAMKEMLDKKLGVPKTKKRDVCVPNDEFEGATYNIPGIGHAFPAGAFKLASVAACRNLDGLKMTQAQQLFMMPQDFVKLVGPPKAKACAGDGCKGYGLELPTEALTELPCWPHMDRRMVRVSNGQPDIRFRPIYWPWACSLDVRFHAGATSAEQIVNLLVLAGETVGIGEMRPERGGNYGRFTVK